MDRVYNNESIVACTMLHILSLEAMEPARLLLITTLVVDDAIRNRISSYTTFNIMAKKEGNFDKALNRKFQGMLPVMINAVLILRQAKHVEYKGKELSVCFQKLLDYSDLYSLKSNRLNEIYNAVDNIQGLISKVRTATIYKRLNIIL